MIPLLSKLSPQERRLIFIAGIIFLFWMLLLHVVDPLWHRLGGVKQDIDHNLQVAQELKSLLQEGPTIEEQYQTVGSYLSPSTETSRSLWLEQLEALAQTHHVQLNLKPLPPKQEARISRFPLEMDAEGEQRNLLAFLDAILGMPQLIVIDRLRLSAVPTKESRLRANLVLQQLVLKSS